MSKIAFALAAGLGASLLASPAMARPEMVAFNGGYSTGTIVVKTSERRLYLVLGDGRAMRYPVGVGKPGKQWSGETRIDGLPDDESRAVLAQLFAHSVRPEHIYRHQWRPHDMVFWDNRSLMHLAAGTPDHLRRRLNRTTVVGDAPF